MPTYIRPCGYALLAILLLVAAPAAWCQDEQTPASSWVDYNHYVRIARPDLALASAQVLLDSVNDGQLLDIVEAGEYPDYDRTFQRAEKIETLAQVTMQLQQRLQAARIKRSRDPDRISADIETLAQSLRARRNATERLRAAGQFAVPQLVNVLIDEKRSRLHPYVLAVLVEMGREVVYPLSVALSQLEPTAAQQLAQVLAEIGYPRALPYLRELVEHPTTDADVRQVIEAADNMLASAAGVPSDAGSAELFLTLGQNLYEAGTTGRPIEGFDTAKNQGVIWVFTDDSGLVFIPVPAPIYADVLAMRTAHRALKLNNNLDQALSLLLMSNARRENRLPDGEADLSYPSNWKEPQFYLEMAGPHRLHDVLDRALRDGDTLLALDAITALGATAGTDALINREGTAQPLLRALSYPDRRVRFPAGFVLAATRPTDVFEGSQRVVPVLAEALRQTDQQFAVIIATDDDARNRLLALVKETGMVGIGGLTMEDVVDQIHIIPGVDLVVTDRPASDVIDLYRKTTVNYKMSLAPILALVSPGEINTLNAEFGQEDLRLVVTLDSSDAEQLKPAVEQAVARNRGEPIDAKQAIAFAQRAVELLQDIAGRQSSVYNVHDAMPALVQALSDDRRKIVHGAANVLAMVPAPDAQLAVADAALDLKRGAALRRVLLNSLAACATNHGPQVTDHHRAKLLDLIQKSKGKLAIAAARAHGALAEPTSNVVEMLTSE